jgi:hypothetical protein
MWNSRTGVSRDRAASWNASSSVHRVRAVLARRARERAERARRAQDADVGRVQVLVRADEDAVAVLLAIDPVGERADAEQVVRLEQREPIGRA